MVCLLEGVGVSRCFVMLFLVVCCFYIVIVCFYFFKVYLVDDI